MIIRSYTHSDVSARSSLSTSKFSHAPRSFRPERPEATLQPTCFGNLQATYNAADVALDLGIRHICVTSLLAAEFCPIPPLHFGKYVHIRAPEANCIGTRQLIASNNGVDLSHRYPVIARERFTIKYAIRLSDNISWTVTVCRFNARNVFQLRSNLIRSSELRSAVQNANVFRIRVTVHCKSTSYFSLTTC
jgi:hypothetical protein